MKMVFMVYAAGVMAAGAGNVMENYPALLPIPARLELRPGQFQLQQSAAIVASKGTEAEAATLAVAVRSATGWPIPLAKSARNGGIELALDQTLAGRLGQEGYLLSVKPDRVLIRSAGEAGLFYGGITLRQLLASPEWTAPCVEIEDQPRFAWRGLLVDVARHYMPPEFLKKFVDTMAFHKLNTLQIHFTDDQGWRLEIKKYPRLTEIGSVRKESPRHGNANAGDGTPYGPLFYTQAEIRELVAYAQARHVTIVPEIEIPGHFRAALTAYPELSCTGGPFEVRTRWGVEADVLCPGNEQSFGFLQAMLAEVTDLFPSRFIHIGGDEAPRTRWKACPKCQARLKAEGFKNEAQLQTYLNRRLERFLESKGRRLIGWDEILEGGLTPGATVMSWRGIAGGIAAAEAGHDVVMSPTTHCYFDYAQARGPGEPESIGGFIPLTTVYAYEPIPAALPAARRKHILGAQGNLWTEFMWTPQDVEYFAYPRACALAEVVWSPADKRNYTEFLSRLSRHLKRLDEFKVNYRKLD
jgi:hexosaminidase